jgi:hypothetical protein
LLVRVRHIARRCGGSLAQCGLVHLTGRWSSITCAQRNLARAVVAECTAQKPTSRLNRRLQRRLACTMPRAIGPVRHLRAHGSMTSGRERMFSAKDCFSSWLDRSTDGVVDNRSGVEAIMKSVPADAGWLASCVPIKSKRLRHRNVWPGLGASGAGRRPQHPTQKSTTYCFVASLVEQR